MLPLLPIAFVILWGLLAVPALAATMAPAEPPPDPGFEVSVQAADVIAEVEIIAGGPFRAVAQTRKIIKGRAPAVFELEGFNSYNWDTVHQGLATGNRCILFLSRTGKPDLFAALTPAAPRLSVQPDGVLLTLGDPPFRIPIKKSDMEDALALLVELRATGAVPERAAAFARGLWEAGDIEPRYLAVALAGALRDARCEQMLIDASKDKLLKLRLTAVDALGKVGTPQALVALRSLLKDEKATLAREAARALVARRDVESLPDLLAWVRRNADSGAAGTAAGAAAKKTDVNQAKSEAVMTDVLGFAAEAGPLLEPGVLARPLFDLVRSQNEKIGRGALSVLIEIVQAAQVPTLLDLADDRTCDLHFAAALALQQVTLASFKDTDEFRAWWAQSGKNFGEDFKRELVESAAKALSQAEPGAERRAVSEIVRMAPGEIALVSAAPVLLKTGSTVFSAADVAAWDSPLAVPFLLERLGRDGTSERRDALEGLVRSCGRHPRLKAVLWPLVRAGLAEEDSTHRRSAQAACGRLGEADGVGALLDAVQYGGGYEGQEAAKALYALSARTLGFSVNEPIPDQNAARLRLRGWWQVSQKEFRPLAALSGQAATMRLWPDMDPAARAARLFALVLATDSRRSGAAFAVAFAERGANDPLWRKLLSQGRQRDRAHGLVGLFGGDATLVPDLAARLLPQRDDTEPPLCRALALVGLAALDGPARPAGAAKIVEWLRGSGAKTDIAWRRLGVICLGLADGDSKSLAYLEALVTQGLAAQPLTVDVFTTDTPSEDYVLFLPALAALCARSDGTPLLMKVLEDATVRRVRDVAARALSLRRHDAAAASILKSLEKAERYDWQELCRILDPILKPSDAPGVNALLDSVNAPARSAGAFILAMRPDVGVDADTRGHLVTGLGDRSSVVRYYCASALGKRRAVSAIEKLVLLLRDDDDDVRSAAAEALGSIGDLESCRAAAETSELQARLDTRWLKAMAIAGNPAHMALLLKLLKSSAYADQRAGYEALGASGRQAAMEALVRTFRNDESGFQTVAGDALAQRTAVADVALREDLQSGDKKVRVRALHLLARVDSPASRAALKRALNDEDAGIRGLAEFGLNRLNVGAASGAASAAPEQ